MTIQDRRISSAEGLAAVARVRAIATSFAEVTESVDKFGHTSFRVRDKPFVIMGESDDGPTLSIKADSYTQERLMARGEWRKTPYIGQHGWVSIITYPPSDWEEVARLVGDGYKRTAPDWNYWDYNLNAASARRSAASTCH